MNDTIPASSRPAAILRRLLRGVLRFGAIPAFLATSLIGAPAKKPNIIYIMADDMGPGDVGCYGGTKIATPNIDRLATQGVRFTDCYAGSPVCAPSRCVLMMGKHSGHATIRDNNPRVGGVLESFGEGAHRLSITASDVTVAEMLKRAGYATGAAGKWGIGEPDTAGTPTKHGFDEWLGYLNQNHAVYYYTDFLYKNESKMPIPENQGGKRQVYSNDLFRDFALDFIRKHKDGPFFLYLPVTIPHNDMEVPSLGQYADKDWPKNAKIYAAMITRLDGYVGEIMGELDRLGIADNTVLFFTSDNGALGGERSEFLNSAGPFRGFKATVYEGGIREPMIVRWPGKIRAGSTSGVPWSFVDFFPTCAALAGVSAPKGLDGEDITPALLGKSPSNLISRCLYWEFPRERLWQAVRKGDWKAVREGIDGRIELYNLRSDPGEKNDVAKSNPRIVADLKRCLDSSHEPNPHWPVQ